MSLLIQSAELRDMSDRTLTSRWMSRPVATSKTALFVRINYITILFEIEYTTTSN